MTALFSLCTRLGSPVASAPALFEDRVDSRAELRKNQLSIGGELIARLESLKLSLGVNKGLDYGIFVVHGVPQ